MADPQDKFNEYAEPPFNPLPKVVIVLAAVILGLEMLFTLGARGIIGGPDAIGWRLAAIENWAFYDRVWDWMLANGRYPTEQMARFVTYPLIHVNFTHALFVVVFVLAMGKLVSEVFGAVAFVAIFVLASVIGAFVYGVALNEAQPLIGGYPGVYGLIGAFTFMLWKDLGAVGQNRLRAFSLIGFLLGIQLIFGLLFGGSKDWLADLSGFFAGFLLSFLLSPGGWAKLLSRLRQR